MRILLGNTGRGGELAAFTAIIRAYRMACPDAYIKALTCHNGIYHHIFQNNQDLNNWDYLRFRKNDTTGKVIRSPIAAWHGQKHEERFDHIEFTAEYDLSPAFRNRPPRPVIENIYHRLKFRPFQLTDIQREVFIYPSDDEWEAAEEIFDEYGRDLVLISHISKSAHRMMDISGYQRLADQLSKHKPVAFTGGQPDPELYGHIDLRGIPFSVLYALSTKLKYFIGPDTATTWLVSKMPGILISLRGDRTYPIENTGLRVNGFRQEYNTFEINVAGWSTNSIIDKVTDIINQRG